ncbi:MAG TPA: energy transducer TonB [Mucilaginibacter sp.]|jgi:protein TonB
MIVRVIIIVGILTISLFSFRAAAQEEKDSSWYKSFPNYDVVPEFQGGIEGFKNYISLNLRKVNGVAGRKLIATFVVEKDGSLSGIKIDRGINDEADNEAIRVLKLSPKWKPCTQKNIPVRVAYSIPITFN